MSDISFSERVRIQRVIGDTLASLTVDSVFFGLFSGACAASLWFLSTRTRTGPRRHLPGTIGSAVVLFLMYVMAFTYLGLDAAATVTGFTDGAGDLTLLEFDITESVEARWDIKMLFLFMQITLLNGFMVYRLFEVWGRNLWLSIVPALLGLATFGAGVSMLVKIEDNFPADFRTTLFFALSSATSGLCAVLIIGRLVGRKSSLPALPLLPRAVLVVLDIIIQSAVIYVAASIGLAVYMASDLSKPRPKWIIGGMPSFIGVTVSAIILWDLRMLHNESENDGTEKLNRQMV